jgi:splicing factor 3A subunit 1
MRKVLAGFTKIAKYNQYEIDVKNKTLENQEEELVAMALIDWHNFIVVETITFTQEEQEFLPAPRADIAEINRMLSQQSLGETEQAMQDQDMDTDDEEEDMDMDEAGEKEKEVEDVVVSSSSAQEIDDDEEELEIVRSQIFESSDASDRSLKFQRCTVCGENIPIEEITNHMRLELLNPKWKEQKQKQLDKQRDSTWASGAGIGASLGKLASRRTDVFVEKNQQAKVAKAPAAPTPAPTGSTIVWDGTADSREAVRVQARAVAASAPPAKPAPTPVHEKAPLAEEKAAPVAPKPAVNVISAGPAPPRPAPDAAQQAQMQQLQMQQQARLAAMQAQATAPQPPVSAPRPVAPPQPAFAPQHVPMQPLQSMMPQPQFQTPFGFPGQHPGMAPMGMNPMMPYGAMGHMVPQMEPPNKKARTGTTMPESEFAAMFPSPIIVVVVVPSNPQYASWNFNGQEIKLTITVTESVEALKEKLVVILGDMPVKKMKMNFEGGASDGVFLNKDNATLAFYNVGPHSRLRLGVKERGGK